MLPELRHVADGLGDLQKDIQSLDPCRGKAKQGRSGLGRGARLVGDFDGARRAALEVVGPAPDRPGDPLDAGLRRSRLPGQVPADGGAGGDEEAAISVQPPSPLEAARAVFL